MGKRVNEAARRGRVESPAHASEPPQELLVTMQAKQGRCEVSYLLCKHNLGCLQPRGRSMRQGVYHFTGSVAGRLHVDSGSFTVDHCIISHLNFSTTGDFYVCNSSDRSNLSCKAFDCHFMMDKR